jgi:hypothetical protein
MRYQQLGTWKTYGGESLPAPRRTSTSTPTRSPSSTGSFYTADLLIADLERQLRRLQAQAAPVHDTAKGAAFHH